MNRTRSWVVALRIAILVVAGSGLFSSSQAQAQWGMGYGFWGLNPLDGSQITQGINQRAAIAGQAAYAARQNIAPSDGGANSYRNFIRDPNFVDRVGISTRRGMESRVAASPPVTRPAPAATPAPAVAPAPTRPATPIIALSGFFNSQKQLVWPAEAPMSGDLASKRMTSDKASLVVLDEVNSRGVASIASVTEARNLLLDYGRPALQMIRKTATPQIADTFHLFLLSLYESLAQAGSIPPAPKR